VPHIDRTSSGTWARGGPRQRRHGRCAARRARRRWRRARPRGARRCERERGRGQRKRRRRVRGAAAAARRGLTWTLPAAAARRAGAAPPRWLRSAPRQEYYLTQQLLPQNATESAPLASQFIAAK
jgi:hypothetical protein